MIENEFYLRDTRSNVGSTCTFWAKNGNGYTSDLDKAEVFNHAKAQKHADYGNHFTPLSRVKVDEIATTRVDMQYLELNCDFSMGHIVHRYVGQYDGNDIFFDDGKGGYTADYSKAKIYESLEAIIELTNQAGAVLSKSFLDTICRRTLQSENVNNRKMITSAGIKYRSPRKPRETTGKTRGNCPTCGKITWDYNYDADSSCADHQGLNFKGW